MHFKDIVGQDPVKQKLLESIAGERIPHAQLFVGPQGSGGLPLALAFAQRMVCSNPSTEDSCGVCPGCLKAAKFAHPDIHFTFPTVGGSGSVSSNFLTQWRSALGENPYLNIFDWISFLGAENKQGNITKAECVQILQKLNLKSFESPNKVLIIWMPEYLKKEGNRLLKIIEEPPENTYIILVADDTEEILGTILSRCQIVKIPQLSERLLIETLKSKHELPEAEALNIARLSDGNYLQALKMMGELDNNSAKVFLSWMRKAWKGNGVEISDWVNEIATIGRENQKFFLQYGLHFLRECLVMPWQLMEQIRLNPEELNTAEKMRQVLDWSKIEAMCNLINDCTYQVERNANPRVLFMDASLQLNNIFKS